MAHPVTQGRELWEKLRVHQNEIVKARDGQCGVSRILPLRIGAERSPFHIAEVFNDCQRLIEELTRQNQDLFENFEGQKAVNRELSRSNRRWTPPLLAYCF